MGHIMYRRLRHTTQRRFSIPSGTTSRRRAAPHRFWSSQVRRTAHQGAASRRTPAAIVSSIRPIPSAVSPPVSRFARLAWPSDTGADSLGGRDACRRAGRPPARDRRRPRRRRLARLPASRPWQLAPDRSVGDRDRAHTPAEPGARRIRAARPQDRRRGGRRSGKGTLRQGLRRQRQRLLDDPGDRRTGSHPQGTQARRAALPPLRDAQRAVIRPSRAWSMRYGRTVSQSRSSSPAPQPLSGAWPIEPDGPRKVWGVYGAERSSR